MASEYKTVRLTKEAAERVEAEHARTGVPRARIVANALRLFLATARRAKA